ncbi:hypothetical protein KXD93_30330 [Mucilaginibacter sp. BJC16-A38]|uniref:hypothetical protein n=1 Tax=Mucilaginibacter phenanthrenivorans TaxID=1234842 RepID=UPI00215716CF|nr:hypothetical protein [Mucilaginibacter phenanthrenivorans]MCR8561991.1 hypothetical protein [Mucilaginibacter phenanthrenivorans]
MIKRITCGFLACLFLTGSLMLPLGDFSLLRDIPKMYQNYTKITSEEEAGVIDFVGDYLLYGKQIFGHNEHDKIPAKGNEVQFQHQASALNIVFLHRTINLITASVAVTTQPVHTSVFYTGDYTNQLFRPPLA